MTYTREITTQEFDGIYYLLSQYMNPGKAAMSYDECAIEALKFIEENKLLDNFDSTDEFSNPGYRLIYKKHNSIRIICISVDKTRIFYEGVASPRFIDELNLVDYYSLNSEEIKSLIKKYSRI